MMDTKASLDWELSVSLSNNDPSIAKELLGMLGNDLKKISVQMQKAFQEDNMYEIERLAHKLHGACCYCGVPRLKSLTQQIEQEAKTHQVKSLDALLEEMNAVIHLLEEGSYLS